MNHSARTIFLSCALAITVASACAAACGAEPGDAPADAGAVQASAPMSLHSLEDRLRQTHALTVLEKLTMKSEINRLLASFRLAHAGGTPQVGDLRQPYDRLLTKIGSSLKLDPQLARDIGDAREALWGVLEDRTQFASRV